MKTFGKGVILIALIIIAPLTAIGVQPERGYRGFLLWSNDIRSNEGVTNYYTGGSTTHGYQFDSMFFVGVGVMAEYCSKNEGPYTWSSLVTSPWFVSVYAEGRADFVFGKFTPYSDFRLGYSFEPSKGVYFSPVIGYRFKSLGSVIFNAGLGLTLTTYSKNEIDGEVLDGIPTQNIDIKKYRTRAYFSFRFGVEF